MLSLEKLESRNMPSVSPVLVNGNLFVNVTDNKNHAVSFDSVNGATQLTVDGNAQLFNGVTAIVYNGGGGRDVVQNNTAINSTLLGKGGDDVLFGGTGTNFIDTGKGKDVVYALLGSNVINVNNEGVDKVFTNFGATVYNDNSDLVVRFFGPNRTPGSGFIGVEDGVLYITPTNNGSKVVINPGKKDSVNVTYDLGDGNGLLTKTFSGVKAISYFGGAGDDLYVNNTDVTEAAYGSAGNDVMLGGLGFSLLKGSGGDDLLVGRGTSNDISGNGGRDIVIFLTHNNIFRGDAQDLVFGLDGNDFSLVV